MTEKKNQTTDLFTNIANSTTNGLFTAPEQSNANNLFNLPTGNDPFANVTSNSVSDPFAVATPSTVADPFATPATEEKKETVNTPEDKTKAAQKLVQGLEERIKAKAEAGKTEEKPKDTKGDVSSKKEKTSAKKPATPKPLLKVDTSWNIAYAGNQDNPPEDNMSLEQVREWLELDYPELSKERTKMVVEEEKKLIVPIVSGAKKG